MLSGPRTEQAGSGAESTPAQAPSGAARSSSSGANSNPLGPPASMGLGAAANSNAVNGPPNLQQQASGAVGGAAQPAASQVAGFDLDALLNMDGDELGAAVQVADGDPLPHPFAGIRARMGNQRHATHGQSQRGGTLDEGQKNGGPFESQSGRYGLRPIAITPPKAPPTS